MSDHAFYSKCDICLSAESQTKLKINRILKYNDSQQKSIHFQTAHQHI